MKYEMESVAVKDKDKLYKLLQYALYDGSQYIDNDIYEAYEDITDNTAYLEYASIVNGEWDSEEWENAPYKGESEGEERAERQ